MNVEHIPAEDVDVLPSGADWQSRHLESERRKAEIRDRIHKQAEQGQKTAKDYFRPAKPTPSIYDSDLKRVAVYARVSTSSEEQISSIENQTLYYTKKIAETENWNLQDPPPSIILHESGAFVTQTALGFDGEATRKMSAFLQGPKPELLHHQKFFENGTAERAKESGTEQKYNMIDGCVNNVPKKPRRIGGRWSVLDRLHIKQAERRQKDNAPQQEQERSRKN